jgi:hypothetical protein
MSNQQPPITTTDAGSPAPSDEYSLPVGARRPRPRPGDSAAFRHVVAEMIRSWCPG